MTLPWGLFLIATVLGGAGGVCALLKQYRDSAGVYAASMLVCIIAFLLK